MKLLKLLKLSVLSVVIIFSSSAYAVQLPAPHVRLWNSDLANEQWFLDFDNKISNGVSAATASWGCSDSAFGSTSNVKTVKIRIESRDATTSVINWSAIEHNSSDPYDSTNEGVSICPLGSFSIGMANIKNSKVVIVASQIAYGFPGGPVGGAYYFLSAFTTTSTSATKLWTRRISSSDPLSLGPNSGWFFSEGLSAIGDFLKGDGLDEVRLVYLKQNTDGSSDWNYVYLDAGTGIQIPNATKSYHVIAP